MKENNKPINILGIETSCDETAAAVVEDGRTIKSSVVASQTKLHEKYGGVVSQVSGQHSGNCVGDCIIGLAEYVIEVRPPGDFSW